MSATGASQIHRAFNNGAIKLRRRLLRFLGREVVLIHTPKCAGSYLRRQYGLDRMARIRSAGHAQFRTLMVHPRSRVVGLIREPLDWYASYYHFCRKSLAEAPQSSRNFPVTHPISLFSKNGHSSFEEMMTNMGSQDFLAGIEAKGIVANIYARDIEDVFGFMRRTGCGFWTWTMLYHFSARETREMLTREDVLAEARAISHRVDFLHQEVIDADVERVLGLPARAGQRVNASPRPDRETAPSSLRALVAERDGDVARILGGY